jgi:hypothetical protein
MKESQANLRKHAVVVISPGIPVEKEGKENEPGWQIKMKNGSAPLGSEKVFFKPSVHACPLV